MLSPPDSRKSRLIAAAGRFTLLVQRTSPSVRYVSLEGRVANTGPATEDQVRLMASRYLPAEAVEGYVDFARHEHIIRMQPILVVGWPRSGVHNAAEPGSGGLRGISLSDTRSAPQEFLHSRWECVLCVYGSFERVRARRVGR